jgi:UDP-glucose 4-epimerase
VLSSARPDIVFHLAAQIDVRTSIKDPAWDAGVNVVGTINLLEAARQTGVKRVVNTSTGGAIYGDAEVMPTPETAPARPMAAYGQSKFCAEAYCGWYERLYGLSSVILRYGNVYGPRQDPHGEGGVVAIFCGKLAEGGTPVAFGDGRQTRDFVYVGDVVSANLAAAGSDWAGACNVGTGTETSVLELADALRALGNGRPFELSYAPARTGEIVRSAVDPALAREVLGWRAEIALAEGLERTLAGVRS